MYYNRSICLQLIFNINGNANKIFIPLLADKNPQPLNLPLSTAAGLSIEIWKFPDKNIEKSYTSTEK